MAVRVLSNETGVEERREAALLPSLITLLQEAEEITQIDVESYGSGQAR
jgi:hypothetical protein